VNVQAAETLSHDFEPSVFNASWCIGSDCFISWYKNLWTSGEVDACGLWLWILDYELYWS